MRSDCFSLLVNEPEPYRGLSIDGTAGVGPTASVSLGDDSERVINVVDPSLQRYCINSQLSARAFPAFTSDCRDGLEDIRRVSGRNDRRFAGLGPLNRGGEQSLDFGDRAVGLVLDGSVVGSECVDVVSAT